MGNKAMGDRAPTYLDHVLHFDALRLVALCEGDRIGIVEILATENERKCLCAHLRTYTQPTQLFAAGTQLAAHSQPALRTG